MILHIVHINTYRTSVTIHQITRTDTGTPNSQAIPSRILLTLSAEIAAGKGPGPTPFILKAKKRATADAV
jgi:hypothetical protein